MVVTDVSVPLRGGGRRPQSQRRRPGRRSEEAAEATRRRQRSITTCTIGSVGNGAATTPARSQRRGSPPLLPVVLVLLLAVAASASAVGGGGGGGGDDGGGSTHEHERLNATIAKTTADGGGEEDCGGDGASCSSEERDEPARAAARKDVNKPTRDLKGRMRRDDIPPQPCGLYLAPSTLPDDSGLGAFVGYADGIPSANVRVGPPDVVLHLPDVDPAHADGLAILLDAYGWDPREVDASGQYEGDGAGWSNFATLLPGIGSVANGHAKRHNVWSHPRSIVTDEADLARTDEPGAGAVTHYHNFSFYTSGPIESGGEIFVNYGEGWFRERTAKRTLPDHVDDDDGHGNDDDEGGGDGGGGSRRSIEWLRENGWCLDNLSPDRSKIAGAGRGAFASRYVPGGGVVAPVPVVPLTKSSLDTVRLVKRGGKKKKKKKVEEIIRGRQLMLNYCYGHPHSDVLLFPYSSVVNLVNHASDGYDANAELRWSESTLIASEEIGLHLPPDRFLARQMRSRRSGRLVMELVALRDILPGEEVLIDYGQAWRGAWGRHRSGIWKPPEDAHTYSPSYVMNDVVKNFRTQEEQLRFPYADNLQTACYYNYESASRELDGRDGRSSDNGNGDGNGGDGRRATDEVTTVKWRPTRRIFEPRYLRPCTILAREEDDSGRKRGSRYTVLMHNRPGGATPAGEVLPPAQKRHIVRHVPWQAVRFVDRPGTTDQHLPNAFRHEVGLPDGVFPEAWIADAKGGDGSGDEEEDGDAVKEEGSSDGVVGTGANRQDGDALDEGPMLGEEL